jgi:transposase-like protein
MAGRKPKLTKELIELLGTALQNGNYIETACDFAGINRATLYRWLQESEEDDAKPILKDLSDTVRKARAQAEMRNVLRIQKAADDSWQAAAWWLERSQPKKWSKQTNVELSGVNGNPINVALDTRAALLELLTPKPDLED